MRTIKIIAASACLACAGATFGMKSAMAQEPGPGAGATAAAVVVAAQSGQTPLPGTVQAGSGELRFLAERTRILANGFDQRFMHLWEFYLAYCEAAFAMQNIDVVQYTLVRDGD